MDHGCQHHADRHQEDEPCVQRVEAGEDLAAVGSRVIDRAHAAEQHGGIQERVAPGQVLEAHVARHAEGERTGHQASHHREMQHHPAGEAQARQRPLGARLVHAG